MSRKLPMNAVRCCTSRPGDGDGSFSNFYSPSSKSMSSSRASRLVMLSGNRKVCEQFDKTTSSGEGGGFGCGCSRAKNHTTPIFWVIKYCLIIKNNRKRWCSSEDYWWRESEKKPNVCHTCGKLVHRDGKSIARDDDGDGAVASWNTK